LLDEYRSGLDQGVDDVPVVHDFVAHVDRRAVFLQGTLDGLNRPVHARAVPPRLCQEHPFADRVVGYPAGCTGNPHVYTRWHDIQGTLARHGLASSRLPLGLSSRLRQSWTHGYCTVRGSAT